VDSIDICRQNHLKGASRKTHRTENLKINRK
jgi:hypothetical protein